MRVGVGLHSSESCAPRDAGHTCRSCVMPLTANEHVNGHAGPHGSITVLRPKRHEAGLAVACEGHAWEAAPRSSCTGVTDERACEGSVFGPVPKSTGSWL